MAVLYAAAFPPLRWRICAWFAMVPFLVAIRRVRTSAAVVASLVFALLGCALTISWIPRAAATYYSQPIGIGMATFLAIALLMVAPYVVAFSLLYRVVMRRPSPAAPLAGAALWVCAEYARSYALTGNPFALLGYSQASAPLVRQVADLASLYGVAFLLAAANMALAEWWIARREPGRRKCAAQGLVVTTGLVVAALLYGRWRLHSEGPARAPAAETKTVLLVQGNVDLGSQWRDELYGENLEHYLRLTLDSLRSYRPQLVVWPENALTFFLAREAYHRLAIAEVLRPHAAELLAGGPHVMADDGEAFLNSAFLLRPDGEIAARYDKEKLLPFAEYFPLPQLDVLRRNFGRVREFTPGDSTPPLDTAVGRAGVLICNESMFPEIAARRTRSGAELLVNLANDSWISDPQYAELALDMSVFRAVEQRRYVVRSSTSGPSAIIDPGGTVRARTAPGTRATLRGDVEPRAGATPYAIVGDAFVAACAIFAMAAVVRARRSPRPAASAER